jgi:hypothetical protein
MDSNIDNDIKDLKNRIKVFKKNLRKHCDKLNSTDVSTTTSVPSSPTSSTDTTTIGPDGSRRTNLSTRRMRDRVTFAPGTATPPITSSSGVPKRSKNRGDIIMETLYSKPEIKNLNELNEKYDNYLLNILKVKDTDDLGIKSLSNDAKIQFTKGRVKTLAKKSGNFTNQAENNGTFKYIGSYHDILSNLSKDSNVIADKTLSKEQIKTLWTNCFIIPSLLYTNKVADNLKFILEIKDGDGFIKVINDGNNDEVPPYNFLTNTFKNIRIEVNIKKDGIVKRMKNWKIAINKSLKDSDGIVKDSGNTKVIFDLNMMDYLLGKKELLSRYIETNLMPTGYSYSQIKEISDKLIKKKRFLLKRDKGFNRALENLEKERGIKEILAMSGGTRKRIITKNNTTRRK